ncbi:cytochrome P450 [Streptomyces sp. NPDC051041]|uniref:cytochrome P450 n=1 Tax=Streptomyces sp. NPDC051041 TaxID=3365640 RepID=UPI00379F3E99
MSEETIPRSAPPRGPAARVGLPGGAGRAWLVTRHHEVRMVTGDPRFSREAVVGRQVALLAPHAVPARGTVGLLDPPGHTRLRRSVAAAFTARGVERVRHRARELLDELVGAMLRQGPPADLTAAVLGPFPIAVGCELMGVPAADRHAMHTWTQLALSRAPGAGAGARARHEMAACFSDLIGLRRDGTGEDATSLLGAAVGRGEVTPEEAVGLAVLLQTGGEAVTDSGRQLLHVLLTRPDLAERLRSEPKTRPRAVDELLRWIPHRAAAGPPRIALEDVRIGGARIRAGDAVHVSYPAANRDPDVFPDPDTIDFSRSPNPHLAFGSGPHRCPGARLARLEAELLVGVLLDRVPGLRPAVPLEDVTFGAGAPAPGPQALPVT